MTDRTWRTVWMSERFWRKSRLAHGVALMSVVALAATGMFAVEDTAKLSGQGLSGIFPKAPPADLSEESFARLNGNWAEWSKGAAAAVADFYAKIDGSDAAAQRQALGALKVKLDVMRRALDDPKYASLHGPLAAIYNSLALRVDFAEAALDTLDVDGSSVGGKSKQRADELIASISSLEGYLAPIGNGSLWLPFFKVDQLKAALAADASGAPAMSAAKETLSLLQTRDYTLDATQKEFTHRAPFEALSSAINHYLASAAWSNSAEATQKLRAEFKTLADSLDTYAVSGQHGSELRKAFGRVRFVSADGGNRLASSLQKRLFNYNLRLMVTEQFMNKLMSQARCESGPVIDCILGAAVSGCQVTNTTVSVNLMPSNNTARFALTLNGQIQSNTQGVTPQATVYTYGSHQFTATKQVSFDGQNFVTSPATINVWPHNTTTGIATKFSGIPILGRLANGIAASAVEAKRGEAEAIAASRVQDGVLPRFNQEADSNFAEQGSKLNNELFGGLRSTGLFPDAYNYQTTDNLLTVNARVMSDDQVAADLPESSLMTTTGATALMHETIINNAIDRMGLAGQTLTEPEVRAKIESFLAKAFNRDVKLESPPPADPSAQEEDESAAKGLNAIIFAANDPIRTRFEDGQLTLIIRAGFKQEGKEDIPTLQITVPISFEVQGDQISVKRGNVIVAAADGEGGGGGVSTRAVVRKKIQSVLPDRMVDSKVEFKGPQKTVVAHVTNIKMTDGWTSIVIE